MLKDYFIVDNILKEPEKIITLSENVNYYSDGLNDIPGVKYFDDDLNKPGGNWIGARSKHLHLIDQKIFEETFNEILNKLLFGWKVDFRYVVECVLHRGTEKIICDDTIFHSDNGSFLAGVIYLNKNPPKKSGTILNKNNNKIFVENKFNRLLIYNSSIPHRTQNFFGTDIYTSRLTLTMFFNKLEIISSV